MKSNPYRYFWNCADPGNVSCIYRLWFGKKFYIGKAKKLHNTLEAISAEIDRRIRLGIREDHIYYKIVNYILRARITHYAVEVVFVSDNPAELLKEEYTLLKKARSTPQDSLNQELNPHIPQWIPQTAVDEFKAWKDEAKKQKKPTKNTKVVSARGNKATAERKKSRNRENNTVRKSKKNTGSLKEKPKRTIQRQKRKVSNSRVAAVR